MRSIELQAEEYVLTRPLKYQVTPLVAIEIYNAFIAGTRFSLEPKFKSRVDINGVGIDTISEIVCKYQMTPREEVFSKSRKREYVVSRQLIMFFMLKYTLDSQTKIGSYFPRDHCTVIHARRTINNLFITNREIRHSVEGIEYIIKKL